jgi:hypothetical protein
MIEWANGGGWVSAHTFGLKPTIHRLFLYPHLKMGATESYFYKEFH